MDRNNKNSKNNSNSNNDKEETVKDIILDLVSEDDDAEIEIDAVMSLAERIDKSANERKEALYIIEDLFKNGPSFMILKSIKVEHNLFTVLETLVKNCKQSFHFDVACKDFQDAILKLLDRIEMKVLYLIQLWYDTFMMHEEEFIHIMNNYKILRKEGIKFPDRDSNEVHMIKFKGMKSPIFQVLEEQQMQKSGIVPKDKRDQLITQPSKSDYAQKFELSSQNLDRLVDNMQLLGAIIDGAQQPEDLQTDYTQELVMFLKSFKTKIMILNSQNQLDEQLGNKKKEIYEFYKQTRILIKNYESKSQEVDQLQQVMQESAIQDYEKINYTKKLKNISIAPPPSKGGAVANTINKSQSINNEQNQPKQTQFNSSKSVVVNPTPSTFPQDNNENKNNQNIQQQSNNIDLLDFESDLPHQNSNPQQNQLNNNISNNIYNQSNNNEGQIPQQLVQQIPQVQQSQAFPIQHDNNLDLFADMNTQPNNFIASNQNQQQQIANEDDFWGEIAGRK